MYSQTKGTKLYSRIRINVDLFANVCVTHDLALSTQKDTLP